MAIVLPSSEVRQGACSIGLTDDLPTGETTLKISPTGISPPCSSITHTLSSQTGVCDNMTIGNVNAIRVEIYLFIKYKMAKIVNGLICIVELSKLSGGNELIYRMRYPNTISTISDNYLTFQPRSTSSDIIRRKPKAKPIVPMLECFPFCVSGISSSTTTYIIAPAAKAKR